MTWAACRRFSGVSAFLQTSQMPYFGGGPLGVALALAIVLSDEPLEPASPASKDELRGWIRALEGVLAKAGADANGS